MAKFHINPETGNVGKCTAEITCPFSGASDHFSTSYEALQHFEKIHEHEAFASQSKQTLNKDVSTFVDNMQSASDSTVAHGEELFKRLSVEDYASEMELANSSPNSKENWITFQDVLDKPELAVNNCQAVSLMLEESLFTDMELDSVDFSSFEILYDDGHFHWANSMTMANGEVVIVDYTINQYDNTLEVPYVASAQRWVDTLRSKVNESFSTDITLDSLKRAFD